jgi:Zn-dependent M28 family amino/carboxypeptidase
MLEGAPAAARRAPLPWVQELVESLTRAELEDDLRSLVGFPTRLAISPEFTAAAQWARGRLADDGYDVSAQPISVGGAPSSNIVADRPGSGSGPRDLVLVGAHLDSINLAGGPAGAAPGADDNGSGSAGLLAIARAFRNHRAIHDLRLILFGGEEQGLHGSRQYVAALSASERERVRAVINMDMIATLNTDAPSVLLEGAPVSRAIIDSLAGSAATYTSLEVQTSLNAANSDHVPFIKKGLPAVLTIEGTDSANANIHSANDTLSFINYDLALGILRMNVAYVAELLGRT